MMALKLTETNINEYGRFEKLRVTVDKTKASIYFEIQSGIKLPPPKSNIKIDELLRRFLLEEKFDVSKLLLVFCCFESVDSPSPQGKSCSLTVPPNFAKLGEILKQKLATHTTRKAWSLRPYGKWRTGWDELLVRVLPLMMCC
jgi:hypothetical protein